MPEPTYGVRPKRGELEAWRAAAVAEGKEFNTWMRDAMNAVLALEAANRAQRAFEKKGAGGGGLGEAVLGSEAGPPKRTVVKPRDSRGGARPEASDTSAAASPSSSGPVSSLPFFNR